MDYVKILILFLIILALGLISYCLYQKTKTNNKQIETFTDDGCGDLPNLLNVNYGETKEKNPNYYIKSDKSLIYLIETKQPFHNALDPSEDFDEIGEVKQSHNYLWVLNKARNRLVRAAIQGDRIQELIYTDVLINNDKDDENLMITAWGVSQDEILEEQMCCIFVHDFKTPGNSYFILFPATETKINIYRKDVSTAKKDDRIKYFKKSDTLKYVNSNIEFRYKPSDVEEERLYEFFFCNNKSGIGDLHRMVVDLNLDITSDLIKIENYVLSTTDSTSDAKATYPSLKTDSSSLKSMRETLKKKDILALEYRNQSDELDKMGTNKIIHGYGNIKLLVNTLYVCEYTFDSSNINIQINKEITDITKSSIDLVGTGSGTESFIDTGSLTVSKDNILEKNRKTLQKLYHNSESKKVNDRFNYPQALDFKLEDYYDTNNIIDNIFNNIVGIIDLNEEESPAPSPEITYDDEKSPIKKSKIRHPRRVIATGYQEIVNSAKPNKISLARYQTSAAFVPGSECIPAQKFTYTLDGLEKELDQFQDVLDSGVKLSLPSLLEILQNNTIQKGESFTSKKFTNMDDWVFLYSKIREEGIYDIKGQDNTLRRITTAFDNDPFYQIQNPEKWKKKHLNILKKEGNKSYDSAVLKIFPNILVYDLSGKKISGEQSNVQKVYLSLKVQKNEEDLKESKYTEDDINPVDRDFHFLKLEVDGERLQETLQDRVFDFYKLSKTTKYQVLNKLESKDKKKHIWYKKIINNFEQFRELVFPDSVSNESDARDRLRGLYQIPDMYVDDTYINYLESNSTNVDETSKQKMLETKNKIRNKNMVFYQDENGVSNKENKIGYPFVVFYQLIDYNGLPCDDRHENHQKIFLSNRVLAQHLDMDSNELKKLFKTEMEGGNNTFRYPLIKQEFLSFAGYGNTIQYYERKFGGITNIDPQKICGDQAATTFIDACSKSENEKCNNIILSYGFLGGTPNCEINNPDVIKTGTSPVEVLVPMGVDSHACDIYILKGKQKFYFSLGKIFLQGKNKYLDKAYTLRNEDLKYLYLDGNEIKYAEKEEIVNSEGTVYDRFKFLTTPKTDSYGSYFLIAPFTKPKVFLTSRVHLYQHTLGDPGSLDDKTKIKWNIQEEMGSSKEENDRTYLNDEDYYAQKFILNESILLNTQADEKSPEQIENMKRKHRIKQSVAATILPELASGTDPNYREPMTTEEEKQALNELLKDINSYLKNVTQIRNVTLPNIQGMDIDKMLSDLVGNMTARVPLIQTRIKNLENNILVGEIADIPSIYSTFKYPEPLIDSSKKKSSDSSKSVEMSAQETGYLSDADMNQLLGDLETIKSTKFPEDPPYQCEGFANLYGSPNHAHLVDKYNQMVSGRIQGKNDTQTAKLLQKINSRDPKSVLQKFSTFNQKVNAVKMDGKKQQMKLSEELRNQKNLKKSVYAVKEYEQHDRLNRMHEKVKELDHLRCKLGDITQKTKVKDHPKYNSITSREDGNLVNLYKITEKCDKVDNPQLNKNMVFVNGGCLHYDEEEMKLNVSHCMANEPQQHFELLKIEDQADLDRYRISSIGKPLEKLEDSDQNRSHYVITKLRPELKEEAQGVPVESKYSEDECNVNYAKFNNYDGDVDETKCPKKVDLNLCLHNENGEFSMRSCENIKNQQWDYSDISGSCQ